MKFCHVHEKKWNNLEELGSHKRNNLKNFLDENFKINDDYAVININTTNVQFIDNIIVNHLVVSNKHKYIIGYIDRIENGFNIFEEFLKNKFRVIIEK